MKINKVKACNFPIESIISKEAKSANFQDSFFVTTNNVDLDVLEIYLQMTSNTPKWINLLLSLRNNIVQFLGLKNVGNLTGKNSLEFISRDKIAGTKIDFFTIETLNNNEMILVLNDKHLDIKLSILKSKVSKNQIFVSTLVNFNNLLGKIYMVFVTPFHKIVVKRLMKNIVN